MKRWIIQFLFMLILLCDYLFHGDAHLLSTELMETCKSIPDVWNMFVCHFFHKHKE